MNIHPEIEQAVREYHNYHKDKNVRLIKFVPDLRGRTAILVRCVNENGQKVSIINTFHWDGLNNRYEVDDYLWCDPEQEKDMISEWAEEWHGM